MSAPAPTLLGFEPTGQTYWLYEGEVYVAPGAADAPRDVTTGLPLGSRWECGGTLWPLLQRARTTIREVAR